MRMHSWEGKLAMLTVLDSIPTTASPETRATAALSSGSNAGRMAPKKMSRMTRAAITPMRVLLDDEVEMVDAAIEPTTSTCRRVCEFGARARFTRLGGSAGGVWLGSLGEVARAKATRL